ncbi:hypothetical protein CUJ83_10305 [Methanocella sp. CWC-04]|uniref:Uncharacterized protein n=1 Tax=Methanooceanicella nereidis TaxID=2052831 RepID=A0AAP2RFY4_9EURY|nr:hypothetical protein [Methanocella sp. CWC-04]MCD1295390.1 hypothetical protein [Methanocella sp. CWC-04]
MLESTTDAKKILTYRIPWEIRKQLGDDAIDLECIKIVSFSDRLNTRGVYLCTKSNEVLEEVAPTPMQAYGLVTIMNGKFVLIQSNGETTLHFSNAKNEDDVIDEVHMLSERGGLADGICAYKSMVLQVELHNAEPMAVTM